MMKHRRAFGLLPAGWLMISYAIILHLVWAMLILLEPAALNTTPINASVVFNSTGATAAMMVSVAMLAIVGIFQHKWRVGIVFLLPQQGVLVASAWGALGAVLAGAYADGVPRPQLFILADQFPAMLAAALHTVALLIINGVHVPCWHWRGQRGES